MSEAVYYQFANARRIEKRDAILIAFSTGRRLMEPRSYLRMHHAMACCIAYWYDQGYVHDAPVTYYSRAFYSNEFPTLLAKREIIAIAFVKPQCKLSQCPEATGRLQAKLQKFWRSGGKIGKKSKIPRKQGPVRRFFHPSIFPPSLVQSNPLSCLCPCPAGAQLCGLGRQMARTQQNRREVGLIVKELYRFAC